MPTTPVNGIDLYHEDHGSGEPFLLLHGFAGTTDMWRPQVTPFSQGRRFITYDMRGHGQSSAPDSVRDYSLDIVVEDQRQLLDRLGCRSGDYRRAVPGRIREHRLLFPASGDGEGDGPSRHGAWVPQPQGRHGTVEPYSRRGCRGLVQGGDGRLQAERLCRLELLQHAGSDGPA